MLGLRLTAKQEAAVNDLITCQRELNDADRCSDEVTAAHLSLEKVAQQYGYDPNSNMRDLMDFIVSCLAEEEED